MKHRSQRNEIPPESDSKIMTPNIDGSAEGSSTSRQFLGVGLLGGVAIGLSANVDGENNQGGNSSLILSLSGQASHEAFRIAMPAAEQIHVSNGQDSNDTVIFNLDDVHSSTADVCTLSLKVKVEGSNNKLAFDFKGGADQVVLAGDSEIIGFSGIEVKQGTVDLVRVAVSAVTHVELEAGLVVTFEQFKALCSVVSVAGCGKLVILVGSDDEVDQLKRLLGDGSMMLIGVQFQVWDNCSNKPICDAELSQILASATYPSIPELSSQINGLADALANGNYNSVKAVSDALAALQSCIDNQDEALWKSVVQLNIDLIETLNAAAIGLEAEFTDWRMRWQTMTSAS